MSTTTPAFQFPGSDAVPAPAPLAQPEASAAECCSAQKQSSCCDASEKSTCCGGTSAGGGSCGCQ